MVPAQKPTSRARLKILRGLCLLLGLVVLVLSNAPCARAQEPSSFSTPLALVGGTVLPSPDAEPLVEAVVLIEKGKIASVGPRGSVDIPETASILSVEGHWVTAGLWNAHVHFGGFLGRADTLSDAALAEVLEMALTRWGFVHVLESHASELENTREIRRRIADGSVAGPSIRSTGAAFDPIGGNHIGLDLPEIGTPLQAHSRVGERIEQGVDAIKLMTGSLAPDSVVPMPLEVARAAVETAHAGGIPVLAHPSDETGARIAIEAGADALAHVFATFVKPDWDRGLIDRMVEREITLIPTLAVFETSAIARAQLRRFQESGGDVVFGTDLGYLTEPDPTSEYWLMERAGMTPRRILASLTTAPARFFGLEGETGRVERGFAADLVVLAADPLEDASNLARVRYAFREGRLLYDGDPWDPDAWERSIARPYVSIFRGVPTMAAERRELELVELSPEEMRVYEGTYPWEEEPLRVWVEDERLRITPIEGLDVVHLIPLGDDEFLQGLYQDGRLVEIYQPGTRVRFLVEDGEADAMLLTAGDWSSGPIERVD